LGSLQQPKSTTPPTRQAEHTGHGVPLGDEVGPRVYGQEERWAGFLAEVEVGDQVAQDRRVLADVRARVGPAVGGRVEALATQEVVLDELGVGVE